MLYFKLNPMVGIYLMNDKCSGFGWGIQMLLFWRKRNFICYAAAIPYVNVKEGKLSIPNSVVYQQQKWNHWCHTFLSIKPLKTDQ